MNYSKPQKFLSFLLILSIFFSFSVRVPFTGFGVFAADESFYDLVSIVVEEGVYDDISSELNRYAQDIQGVLANTKVVILPTPKNTTAFKIASLNESLFFEGYKAVEDVSFRSKLVGSVFVGDLNLPVVHDNNDASKTILPFVDFEDKVYIYNNKTQQYEKNNDNINGLQHEIWHGVISPNLGDEKKNVQGLKDYFDKNHDFYQGTGNFQLEDQILNGKKSDGVPVDYQPYVFYYDGFRESEALNYNNYLGYQAYDENKEDIVYNRFSKELAEKIKNDVLGKQNESISELISKVDSGFDISLIDDGMDLGNAPDIQTRHIITKATKNFLDIFAKGAIGDVRKNVHNAGRYNDSNSQVNVDMIPFLITVLDLVNDEILKDIGNDLEDQIDEYVDTQLAQNIIIPVSHVRESSFSATKKTSGGGENGSESIIITPSCGFVNTNFYYGQIASSISKAEECSIYRGSIENGGKLVEANRGINTNNVQGDLALCNKAETLGYWGGNSPVNLDIGKASKGNIELGGHNLQGGIRSIFDIAGSKQTGDISKVPSPLDCYDVNMLVTSKEEIVGNGDSGGSCALTYRVPVSGSAVNWTCNSTNIGAPAISLNMEISGSPCLVSEIVLDGNVVRSSGGGGSGEICPNGIAKETYTFKSIPSIIKHKSPTPLELTSEIRAMATPDLPVDKNRYVDFISSKTGAYAKIDYPHLFRLDFDADTEITFENTKIILDTYLNDTTKNIDNLNNSSGSIDLKGYIEHKALQNLQIGTETKSINHFDTLAFAVFWNNLRSSSAKYKFIFENYLSDEFGGNGIDTHLAKNKKQYEIAYLGASGDAGNMYVKLDPEDKSTHPYGDIIGKNLNLSTSLMGSNIGGSTEGEGIFKCAPPEGVPIWEWIPAVVCWLGNMLPPTISISEGTCGPSLLSDDEREEVFSCNGDVNKNGINDCIESKLDSGKIELTSDAKVYYYNKTGSLQAKLKDQQGNVVHLDNATNIHFEIAKIETDKGIVYSKDDAYKQDQAIIDTYINFAPQTVRVSRGEAIYSFVTKNLDADIYFNAFVDIKDNDKISKIYLDAPDLQVSVRGERLFAFTNKIENNNGQVELIVAKNTIIASDQRNIYLLDSKQQDINNISQMVDASSLSSEKLVFSIENIGTKGEKLPIFYPIKVKLLDDKKQVGETLTLSSNDLKLFSTLPPIKKSGSYTLEVVDNKGFTTSKNFDIVPDIASKGETILGTNLMKTGGSISTNLITITDKYDNPVAGQLYNIDMSLSGGGIIFEENKKSDLKLNTLEGYKAFRFLSTETEGENILSVSIKDTLGNTLIEFKKYIKTLKDISLVMKPLDGQVVVGGGIYRFEISLRGDRGNILTGFDSRVYMGLHSMYGKTTKPYVDFIDGKAIVELQTGTVAGKDIPVEFQVEGFGDILHKTLTIYPGSPMKLDLSLSNSKIEAAKDSKSLLRVELKDRYNNIVFNDNSTTTRIEILDRYAHIISSDVIQTQVKEGISYFNLSGTINPGTAYFKVKAEPGFENNSFIVSDTNNSLTISGVSENAGKIETFYFWNSEKLADKKYNALYTTLLGAPYGDITKENYLAGGLLFNKNNRSLAVTSLLNNPYNYNDIIQVSPNSGISFVQNAGDITQDIEPGIVVEGGKISVNLWNKSLNTYIGKILYNFGKNSKLQTCENIDTCDESASNFTLISQDDDFSVFKDGDNLVLQDRFGKNILDINSKGEVTKGGLISFKVSEKQVGDYLLLDIYTGDNLIGNLSISSQNINIDISRELGVFNSKVETTQNNILVYLNSNTYNSREIYNGDTPLRSIYYHDPFESTYSLNSFSRDSSNGYENFVNQGALGWDGGNKTLLSFSAGKSVGESVQDYASFSIINLGDPVISLKKVVKSLPKTTTDRKFDATIGKLLSNDDNISSYQIFDYNNDNADDILLVKNDSYLKLLENVTTQSQFLDMGNLAYLVDLGNKDLVKTGDFTGDGYDDIFFVNQDGLPFLLNNHVKDFVRVSLQSSFNLEGRIIRAEVFDMDNDGKTDIVVLDDSGRINIFYGGGSSSVPSFIGLTLSESYGITLNNNIRNDNGFVYFEGLPQLAELGDNSALLKSNEAYLQRVAENFDNNTENNEAGINEDIFNSLIFETIQYGENSVNSSPQDQVLNNIVVPESAEISGAIDASKSSLSQFLQEYSTDIMYSNISGDPKQTTFIKSEYSDLEGLQVDKVFTDRNGGNLKSDDIIDVSITLTNTSNTTLNNIAYVESIPELFSFDSSTMQVSQDVHIDTHLDLYAFLVDGFSLARNQSITIKYQMNTLPLQYGYLKVGLYEEGEIGSDQYGDIIVKDTYENCSQTAEIFRSISARDYGKGITAPVCDDDKIKLPDSIAKNAIDANNNGLPDYLDELTGGTTEKIQEYAQEQLSKLNLDTDGDGIPDREDTFNASGDITSNLTEITDDISGVLDDVDGIMQGLSCGFGGGGCISTPLNWAPLAPGSDPTAFGFPIGDGLSVGEGIPIFSALTGIPLYGPWGCIPIPSTWPPSPLGLINVSTSGAGTVCDAPGLGAGGYLGTMSPTNFFRFYVTPTITGAVGIAACFGGPAIIAGNVPPKGLSPMVPGGNCVVAAAPLLTCSDDGSDGDVASTGFSDINGNFQLYNGNCNPSSTQNRTLSRSTVQDYLNYKKSPQPSENVVKNLKNAFKTVADVSGTSEVSIGTEPLISMNGGEGGTDFKVDIDTDAFKNGDFSDVLKISMKRVPSFPGFLMDWVTRQIEEIVTKLTDFPTVFIILPDFTGLFDGKWSERTGNKGKYDEDLKSLNEGIAKADALIDEKIENKIGNESAKKITGATQATASTIKDAYEFLANIPLVQIEQETVNINVPWVDNETIDRTWLDWTTTVKSRRSELERAKNVWSLGELCNESDPLLQEKCEKDLALKSSLILDTENLIHSLEQNLEVIQSYKDIPKDINKMVNTKQYYLEQILCNIESISNILGGRIGKNGERFKAWVELYVLIKAILKSWQLLIDIFIVYDAECHECKNERSDLMTMIWSVIDMVIPKIPIIKFPKWPDIILDLHNIRAGLNIVLPEYSFETRPILLPSLPELFLPDVPSLSLGVTLPSLPILPTLEISMLPDLPSLPTVELPDLPPPPTIPKLFGSLEAILDILKLITKIMCLLRSSPFVPEWRAGDLISFITERQGFMSLDFLQLSLPQFSYPFVDAIEVTSYVNLEFDVDFIVEMARQTAIPINTFTNDITHLLDIEISDIDLTDTVPESIDVNIDLGDSTGLLNHGDVNSKTAAGLLVLFIVKGFGNISEYLENHKNERVDSLTFKQFVNKNLASETMTSDPKLDELRVLWSDVNNLTYSKENKLIQELEDNNTKKFQLLNDIINTEIEKNKELKNNFELLFQPDFIKSVSVRGEDDVKVYNQMLSEYNDKFIKAALNIISPGENLEKKSLQADGEKLIKNIKTPLTKYAEGISVNQKLLALEEPVLEISDTSNVGGQNSCQQQASSDYKYTYKGLYIVENNISYRLFDYLDNLDGKEKTTLIDVDNDTDGDLIYMADGEIFLKENLNITLKPLYVSEKPLVINSDDNRIYTSDISNPFYESVNNFREIGTTNNAINMIFSSSTLSDIFNYRAEFFRITDRFIGGDTSNIEPDNLTKSIVDGFADIENATYMKETDMVIIRKNLGYIRDIGITKGVKMISQNLIDISDNIKNNTIVHLAPYTKIYAGGSSFTLKYTLDGSNDIQALVVGKYQNIELKQNISVSGITGNAYIKGTGTSSLEGEKIKSRMYLPLFAGDSITYTGDRIGLNEKSHIDIRYYDDSEAGLDFRELNDYLIYDLGPKRDDYVLRIERENDFYYAKIKSFKENKFSTNSNKSLLSPQIQADSTAPNLFVDFSIKVPVYQKKIFDLTPYIYEDGGVRGVSDIFIDTNIDFDSSGDGNPKNDRVTTGVNIIKTSSSIQVEFGPFTTLTKRNIGVTLKDINNNISYKEVPFEVYAPQPKIEGYKDSKIDGSISEDLTSEPVTLYRYRGGSIEKLKDTQGVDTAYTKEGNYDFSVQKGTSGLNLKVGGAEVATVNETTGKIDMKDGNGKIKILASNDQENTIGYPEIRFEYDGTDIYYEYMKAHGMNSVELVDTFDNITKNGIYVQFMNTSSYGFYKIPEAVEFNPGALVIYRVTDLEKEPLFTLYKDGKVDTLNTFYKLEYDTLGDYIVFKMIDKHFNREVARVLFQMDGEFIME